MSCKDKIYNHTLVVKVGPSGTIYYFCSICGSQLDQYGAKIK